MGLTHGKCTFTQVPDKKAPTENTADNVNQKEEVEVSLEVVNGVVTTTPDVPLIDEIDEKAVTNVSQLENKPEDQEKDVSGDTSKVEDKSGARRSSTKVVLKQWFKQHIPKKSFRKQSRTEPEKNDQAQVEATITEDAEQKVDCSQAASVADNLVNEVITSAASIRAEAVMQEQARETAKLMNDGDNPSQSPVEDSTHTAEPEVINQSVEVEPKAGGDIQTDEDVVCDQINDNNTNVFNEDVIASKLANIELVNGQHTELVNGNVHTNGYTNGHTEILVNGNHHLDCVH